MKHLLKLFVFLAFAVSLGIAVAEGGPAHVLVRGAEQGQGLLLKRFDECYLLTAEHVLGKSVRAAVTEGGRDARLGQGSLVATFPEFDLALLRITGAASNACGTSIRNLATNLDELLVQRGNGYLSYVYEDGGIARTPVVAADIGPDQIRVRTVDPSEGILQGQSGSMLLVGDRPAGILLSVESGGEGRVLRFDVAIRRIEEFFRNPTPPPPLPPASTQVLAPAPGNLLVASQGGQAVAWTGEPESAETSPENLIEGTHAQSYRVQTTGQPISVDFRLNGNGVHNVGRVELTQAFDGLPAQRLRDYELLVGRDGQSWKSVAHGTLMADEQQRSISFAPVRASHLRLRMYSNWGDTKIVSIRAVRVFSK